MLGIICGGGKYPRLIAESCREREEGFCLLLLNGFCNAENWPDVPKISVNLGDVEATLDFFHSHNVTEIVFAGDIKRPNFASLSLDKKGRSWLISLGKDIFAGDDVLLRGISKLFLKEGFTIVSGTSFLHNIFVGEGQLSEKSPSIADECGIQVGFYYAKKLGSEDLGQSVVVKDGSLVDLEDEHGTDNLISRNKGGILVKVCKPQQDRKLDLPTIGVNTIENMNKCGFRGIAIEADSCIVLDKESVVKKINEYGMFFVSKKYDPLKVFIIAGESSGDYLGGMLMRDIKEITNHNVEFFGVGGTNMQSVGMRKLFSVSELSIIGIKEVIGKIFHVIRLIKLIIMAILSYKPHVVVTIDSSGFTHRVAKRLKKINKDIPIVHYVAPPVWAWRRWRAKTMHKFIDKLLTLFPFESEIFQLNNLNSVFVGHPIFVDKDFEKPDMNRLRNFLHSCKADESYKIVTLLPGSRLSEINKHMPVLAEFADLMCGKYRNTKFIIPTIEEMKEVILDLCRDWKEKPIVVTTKSQKVLSYYCSDFAVAASGTVTLELARVKLPFIVMYKTSALTYRIVKSLIKIPYVCLVNILAKKTVVPEFLQCDCTAENIFNCAEKLLDGDLADQQKEAFSRVINMLKVYDKKAAHEVIKTARK